jgi:hypothetical protein
MILALAGLGLGAAFGVYVGAQQSGSGLPAGSTFSTQIKLTPVGFGGVGPGSAGEVLTSNGAGMAPSYQAASTSSPGGADTNVQFNDAGAFGGDTGLTYSAAGDDLTIGDQMQAARINLTNELQLNGSAGASGQVLTSAGDNTLPTWSTPTAAAAITVGTFAVTYPNCCGTTPTQNWAYVKTSDGVNAYVTVYPTDIASGTGDATTFNTAGGTAMPAAVRPLQAATFGGSNGTDNGTPVAVTIQFATNGNIFLGNSGFNVNTVWTGSGAREFPATNLGFAAYTYRVAP